MTRRLPLLLLPLLLALPARADSLSTTTGTYEGSVRGLQNGKLAITLKNGTDKRLDLSELPDANAISLDAYPKFAEAEADRPDALRAVADYKALIPALNNPDLKLLAQARAIDPYDRNGNFSDAVALFLNVYLAAPNDTLWNLRPTHLPGPNSKMLPEAADKIAAALKTAPTEDARKNLRTFLLQIYTQAGDTDAAQRLAREITTGIAEDPHPAPAMDPALVSALNTLEVDLTKKDFNGVLEKASALLTSTPWSGQNAAAPAAAVQLFTLKARALEGLNQLDLASAAWLRIPAHYPDSTAAPNALLHAAALQLKQNHNASAQSLLQELRTQYPNSPESQSLNR